MMNSTQRLLLSSPSLVPSWHPFDANWEAAWSYDRGTSDPTAWVGKNDLSFDKYSGSNYSLDPTSHLVFSNDSEYRTVFPGTIWPYSSVLVARYTQDAGEYLVQNVSVNYAHGRWSGPNRFVSGWAGGRLDGTTIWGTNRTSLDLSIFYANWNSSEIWFAGVKEAGPASAGGNGLGDSGLSQHRTLRFGPGPNSAGVCHVAFYGIYAGRVMDAPWFSDFESWVSNVQASYSA